MKLPITITQVAQQPKILPLNKIIKSSDFTIKQLNPNTVISKEDENIRPTEVGTIVDYLSRYVLLADEHAFDIVNDNSALEIWVSTNGEMTCLYLFEYDEGVVTFNG